MAEYISRDALLEMLSERLRNTCNGSLSCIQMKRLVESVPTADVAPKSEVASEIFAEIDKIRLMEKCFQRVNVFYDTASEYEKIKKKYTEGEG